MRKLAEPRPESKQASKQLSSVGPASASASDSALTSLRDRLLPGSGRENNPFLPHVVFGQCFITVIVK